jgi:hypothetical protein
LCSTIPLSSWTSFARVIIDIKKQLRLSVMWISFSRYSPNWRVFKECSLTKSKNNSSNIIRNCQWEGKNPRQAGKWVCIFLLANSQFYSHMASWE